MHILYGLSAFIALWAIGHRASVLCAPSGRAMQLLPATSHGDHNEFATWPVQLADETADPLLIILDRLIYWGDLPKVQNKSPRQNATSSNGAPEYYSQLVQQLDNAVPFEQVDALFGKREIEPNEPAPPLPFQLEPETIGLDRDRPLMDQLVDKLAL